MGAILVDDLPTQIPPSHAIDQFQAGMCHTPWIEVHRKSRPIVAYFQASLIRLRFKAPRLTLGGESLAMSPDNTPRIYRSGTDRYCIQVTNPGGSAPDLGFVWKVDAGGLQPPGQNCAGYDESELELLIWQILRRHGVRLPERQVKVRLAQRNYRLDLAYRLDRVFIEGDGFGVHSTRSAFESDRTRQNNLVIAGWVPLRFTWQQARHSEEKIADQVRAALTLRHAAC